MSGNGAGFFAVAVVVNDSAGGAAGEIEFAGVKVWLLGTESMTGDEDWLVPLVLFDCSKHGVR